MEQPKKILIADNEPEVLMILAVFSGRLHEIIHFLWSFVAAHGTGQVGRAETDFFEEQLTSAKQPANFPSPCPKPGANSIIGAANDPTNVPDCPKSADSRPSMH